ncbi:MAG: radical SAM/SPASM domain-containing protein [Clostridia bacterium]
MFKPEEIIFAATAQCNLACGHCRVTRIPQELESPMAIAFMESCRGRGVERIGFSGGEPFLRPDFLYDVCRAAVEKDYYFGRLMTNGCWADDEAGYMAALEPLHEAGFDGIFGLSFDSWHGNDVVKAAGFLQAVFRIWGRKDVAEILAVNAPRQDGSAEGSAVAADEAALTALATGLGGVLQPGSAGQPAAIVDQAWLARTAADPDDGSGLYLPVQRFPYSAAADEEAWGAEAWFENDYCEGPGNVFYVHPDGRVAVCCGFANENDELIIGNIACDGYDQLMAKAAASTQVHQCYDLGLAAFARQQEAAGRVFPGKTGDLCFFCDYLCKTRSGT